MRIPIAGHSCLVILHIIHWTYIPGTKHIGRKILCPLIYTFVIIILITVTCHYTHIMHSKGFSIITYQFQSFLQGIISPIPYISIITINNSRHVLKGIALIFHTVKALESSHNAQIKSFNGRNSHFTTHHQLVISLFVIFFINHSNRVIRLQINFIFGIISIFIINRTGWIFQ